MGLRSGNRVYAWVQNLDHTWWNYTHGITVSPQSGTISIHDLTPGAQYILETWDTYTTTQQVVSQVILTAQADGSLLVNVASLQTDLAYKLRPVLVPRKFMPSTVN
jgi:hypothetical protein